MNRLSNGQETTTFTITVPAGSISEFYHKHPALWTGLYLSAGVAITLGAKEVLSWRKKGSSKK